MDEVEKIQKIIKVLEDNQDSLSDIDTTFYAKYTSNILREIAKKILKVLEKEE